MNDPCGRFFIAKDMNGDFVFTITDVWLIAKYIWLLPAKAVVYLFENSPSWARFFEITCSTGESLGGAIFSLFVWGVVLAFISVASDN